MSKFLVFVTNEKYHLWGYLRTLKVQIYTYNQKTNTTIKMLIEQNLFDMFVRNFGVLVILHTRKSYPLAQIPYICVKISLSRLVTLFGWLPICVQTMCRSHHVSNIPSSHARLRVENKKSIRGYHSSSIQYFGTDIKVILCQIFVYIPCYQISIDFSISIFQLFKKWNYD